MTSTILPPINGRVLSSPSSTLAVQRHSATIFKWGWRSDKETRIVANSTGGRAFQIPVNLNEKENEDVNWQPNKWQKLELKKNSRRRQIEAINGAWAMVGLTAGLVIEGQTGKNILAQLAGYLNWMQLFIFVCGRLLLGGHVWVNI